MYPWLTKMEPGAVARYRRYKLYAGLVLLVVLLAVVTYP